MSFFMVQLSQRGISGRKNCGCDAIIVSGKRANTDYGEFLVYVCEWRIGANCLLENYLTNLPIRVFRNAKYIGAGHSTKSMYRYDGLYKIVNVLIPHDRIGTFHYFLKQESMAMSVDQVLRDYPKPPRTSWASDYRNDEQLKNAAALFDCVLAKNKLSNTANIRSKLDFLWNIVKEEHEGVSLYPFSHLLETDSSLDCVAAKSFSKIPKMEPTTEEYSIAEPPLIHRCAEHTMDRRKYLENMSVPIPKNTNKNGFRVPVRLYPNNTNPQSFSAAGKRTRSASKQSYNPDKCIEETILRQIKRQKQFDDRNAQSFCVKEPMDWCEPQDRPTFYGADRNCPP
jgi:hypothetical protein